MVSYLLGFAAAYTGWYSLARTAGLGRWQAQVPGLVFIASAYYLTLIYARGDWPEFIAVSALPLLVAALVKVMLAERLSLRWAAALVVSTLLFFGSHNLTMLWGVTALVIAGLLVAAAIPQARRLVSRRGLIRVAALVTPAALANAWYLLPALAYGQRTAIAHEYDYVGNLRGLMYLVDVSHLFTFSHATIVENTPDFALALPVLAVVWVLVSLILSLVLRGDRAWRRALWVFAVLGVGWAILMTHAGLILDLPHPYTLVQFSYRLKTYVLLALGAAMLAALVLVKSWPGRWRVWSWTTIVVVLASAIGAVQQVDSYPRHADRLGWCTPTATSCSTPLTSRRSRAGSVTTTTRARRWSKRRGRPSVSCFLLIWRPKRRRCPRRWQPERSSTQTSAALRTWFACGVRESSAMIRRATWCSKSARPLTESTRSRWNVHTRLRWRVGS